MGIRASSTDSEVDIAMVEWRTRRWPGRKGWGGVAPKDADAALEGFQVN